MIRALLIGLLLLCASARAQTAPADRRPVGRVPDDSLDAYGLRADFNERFDRLNAEPLPSAVPGLGYEPEDLSATPSGGDDVPPLTGRIVDLADLLSPSAEAALTARLAAFEDSTSNQVAVLTIPSLQGAVLEEYATRVFREWALGQAGRDNGVLLLVSRDDRELRIEVGYGLEGSLTDARSATIIRNGIVPHFRDGDYEAGLLAGTEAILASIEGTYEPSSASSGAMLGPERWLFGGMIALFPLLGLLGALRTGWPDFWGAFLAGLVGLFAGVFVAVAAAVATRSSWALVWIVLTPLVAVAVDVFLERSATFGPPRRERRRQREARAEQFRLAEAKRYREEKAFREARTRGDSTVVIDGVSRTVPPAPSASSGSSRSGGSSSSFGGGGSSGGGGASGSW